MEHPTPEEFSLEVRGLRLAARAHGAADGTPVLALHGWLDNAASFDVLAPRLGGRRIVALDLPGHGHSAHRPPGEHYHVVDYVGDVVAAADALEWPRFSLLGHSLGGSVAALVAAALPERINRLALIDALGPLAEAPANAPRRLAQAMPRPNTDRAPRRRYADIGEAVAARRAAGPLSEAAARRLVERGTIADAEGIRWRSDPRLRQSTPYRLTEEQVLAYLTAIEAPTLLIAAADGYLPSESATLARRLTALSDARVHRLPGHHHLHLDDPAPTANLLDAFFHMP